MTYVYIRYGIYMDVVNNPYTYSINYGKTVVKNVTYGQYKSSVFKSELLTELLPDMASKIKYLEI